MSQLPERRQTKLWAVGAFQSFVDAPDANADADGGGQDEKAALADGNGGLVDQRAADTDTGYAVSLSFLEQLGFFSGGYVKRLGARGHPDIALFDGHFADG